MLALRSLFFYDRRPGHGDGVHPVPDRVTPLGTFQSWTLLHTASVLLMAIGAAILFRCIWDFATKGRGKL